MLVELQRLALSTGSALQKIRIDLGYHNWSNDSELLRQGIKHNVHWAGFTRLRLLEVNVNTPWDVVDIPDEPQRVEYIEDLKRRIRGNLRLNRADVDVLVTFYIRGEGSRSDDLLYDYRTYLLAADPFIEAHISSRRAVKNILH